LLWERSKVIEGIERRGRLTRPEELARTEREYLFQSHDLATTPKKMTMLMRQIAGKTLEEALVQMRFSKKKVARDIVIGLLKARDEAIVARGMGLGRIKEAPKVEVEFEQKEGETEEEFAARKAKAEEEQLKFLEERVLSPGTYITPKDGPSTTIELKDGSRKQVYDPTEIYIDQAWATKGIYDYGVDYRARGQAHRLRHRTASKFLARIDHIAVYMYTVTNPWHRDERPAQRGEDAHAYLRRDQEEARQPQALGRVARPPRHSPKAVLPMVV
jgi:ribosomal protein L22